MTSKKGAEAKLVSLKLKGITRPLSLEFAARVIDDEIYDESDMVAAFTGEWGGALPEELIGDDLLANMRSFLYNLFDFALQKAKKQERYSEGDEGTIHIEPNPYYDDSSCVTIHHPVTSTLLYHSSFKTYYFDPEYLEDILKDAMEGIRGGIELVRRRLAEMKPFKCQGCGSNLPDRKKCPKCGSEDVY